MTNSVPAEPPHSNRRGHVTTLVVMILLVIYWIALFYGTHARLPEGLLPGSTDKLIHCSAYGGLAILLMTLRATRGPFPWSSVIARWFVLAGYGAFDELTQMLVGRDAEVYDWLADVVGVAMGLCLVTVVDWVIRSLWNAPASNQNSVSEV